MKLAGLRKDKDTDEIIEYELKLNPRDITCLYKDQYGVYLSTKSGKLYKINLPDIESLEKVIDNGNQ